MAFIFAQHGSGVSLVDQYAVEDQTSADDGHMIA
jgi:hypothetical protein